MAAAVRLGGRLLVIAALWLVWPGSAGAQAAAVLSLCLAAGCAVAAITRDERISSRVLNRWFEAVVLLIVAGLIAVAS